MKVACSSSKGEGAELRSPRASRGAQGTETCSRRERAQGLGSGVPGGVLCLLLGVTQLCPGSREAGLWGVTSQPSELDFTGDGRFTATSVFVALSA